MSEPIDIHMHWCSFGKDPAEIVEELCWLEKEGLGKIVIYVLPALGASPQDVWEMIPGSYRDLTGLTVERAAHDDMESWGLFLDLWNKEPHSLEVIGFLDVRAWDGVKSLSRFWGEGFAGLKGIILEEEDEEKMRMLPIRHVNELTRNEYLDAQREIFNVASSLGVPLVYHADLNNHMEFIEECLQDNPGLRVNIPHIGFSRKKMARLLEAYPALFTDISSLGPYLRENPSSYRNFCLDFPDRVLLGSDSISSYDMRAAIDYLGHAKALGLPGDAEAKLLFENAEVFLYGEKV